jgi:hypothetical protein
VEPLPVLDPTDAERAEARTALLQILITANPWALIRLVKALSVLDPTDAERAEADVTAPGPLVRARPHT